MELGTHWHQVLQERAGSEDASWRFEQSVSGQLSQNGWQFDLRGRIDQFRPGDPPVLREIKTTSTPLPADEGALRERYPHYFHQAMLYAFLMGKDGDFPKTELLFLEIQTGMTQTVRLGELDLDALYAHLQNVVTALEERQAHFGRLRAYTVPQPFADWRPGQLDARNEMERSIERDGTCLFEAPTGFGKTGLALEQGLKRLAAGDVDRILLLTGKNTGHTPLLNQLQAFLDTGHILAVHALRSRKDLALDDELERKIPPQEILDNWKASGLSAPGLLEDGIMSLEAIKSLGQRHGIPPWAISRMLLPHADIWIADYNYLFDPGVSHVLESIPTYDPSRTQLIIDEAHNLPGRVAACHSHMLDASELDKVLSEIQFARFSGKLARHMDLLLSIVRKQSPCDALDPPQEADLIGTLRELLQAIRETGFLEDELSADSVEWLWNISYLLADWDHPHLSMLVSSPKRGRIQLSCVDASEVIAPELNKFFQTTMMSATIRPWEAFLQETGLGQAGTSSRSIRKVVGTAPWLDSCFEVMVDARVDTRYRQRDRYLDKTARTIGETALSGKGCTVAFFPSYAYAEKVLERLRFTHPVLRCTIQPRNLPLEEQSEFLESALILQDALFLILGSRFSEGIDSLGGKISQAIVVGPALPEVNSLQRARESMVPGGPSVAFQQTYLIPGLRKISQALGRLVRSPEHRAKVLLHGKRFIEPAYQDLLPSYLQPEGILVTDEDLHSNWLSRP
jgi:Rad3-related DNA helicase